MTVIVCTAVASLEIVKPNQENNLKHMSNHQLSPISKYPDDAEAVLNQIVQDPATKSERRWYTTPGTCDNPLKINKTERSVYDEISNSNRR